MHSTNPPPFAGISCPNETYPVYLSRQDLDLLAGAPGALTDLSGDIEHSLMCASKQEIDTLLNNNQCRDGNGNLRLAQDGRLYCMSPLDPIKYGLYYKKRQLPWPLGMKETPKEAAVATVVTYLNDQQPWFLDPLIPDIPVSTVQDVLLAGRRPHRQRSTDGAAKN